MPYLTSTFVAASGPLIDLWVGVSDQRKTLLERVGFRPPDRLLVKALVDSGAGVTTVAPQVLQALDLRALAETEILTASTGPVPQICGQFDVSLTIAVDRQELHVPMIYVVEALFAPEEGIQVLLGRDILRHCLFVYDGRHERLSLAF